MSHPLAQFENLRLIYKIESDTFSTDPITGIKKRESTNLELKIAVVQRSKVRTEELAGRDLQTIYIKGNLIEPKTLPSQICAGNKYAAHLKDPYTQTEIAGEFLVELRMQPAIPLISQILGNEISGYFLFV